MKPFANGESHGETADLYPHPVHKSGLYFGTILQTPVINFNWNDLIITKLYSTTKDFDLA